MIIEFIITFVFVFAILGITSKVENGKVAGLVIGFLLTLVHILDIHFAGTLVNPAHSFRPAVFAGGNVLSNVWVFIVAPLIGVLLWHLFGSCLTVNQKLI
ncbi:MAG: aquaporin [Clostridia bacterium]|nr:aquaporin [Clostridia bacterium]